MLVFTKVLFYLIMAIECKRSSAGNLGRPKRSCKGFPLFEKVSFQLCDRYVCMYIYIKGKTVYIGIGTIQDFRHTLGVLRWNLIPEDKGGLL